MRKGGKKGQKWGFEGPTPNVLRKLSTSLDLTFFFARVWVPSGSSLTTGPRPHQAPRPHPQGVSSRPAGPPSVLTVCLVVGILFYLFVFWYHWASIRACPAEHNATPARAASTQCKHRLRCTHIHVHEGRAHTHNLYLSHSQTHARARTRARAHALTHSLTHNAYPCAQPHWHLNGQIQNPDSQKYHEAKLHGCAK